MALLGSTPPSPEEHAALLQELGPLPLKGTAWPAWIKILAWVVLIVIGIQLALTATGEQGQNVNPVVAASILLCFVALLVVARYMVTSETQITEKGIEQSWISRRAVAWEDIQFAKFIPLVASKKLVCFTARGRPVIFQAGTQPLQIAFARIALVYKRK